jgi:hypothetical protein
MTKENWISESNVRLSRTSNKVDEKIWLSMRCVKMIGGILVGKNKKGNKNRGRFLGCMIFDLIFFENICKRDLVLFILLCRTKW